MCVCLPCALGVAQDMYLWAAAIIGSRAVHLSGDRFLVPFADMFNYKPVAVRA